MSEPAMPTVSPAASADLLAIRALLTSSGLPTADVQADSHPEFLITRHNGHVIGVVGLERFGDVGLLRSLAVQPEHRGTGLGIALTQALERHAGRSGLASLVLLTETAEAFFRARGYRVIKRAEAPPGVQASQEFRSLCPDSAVCMQKELRTTRS